MANLRTPLFARHQALHARIVPFAGWDMPVHYRGIIEEHNAVRTSVGIFDISHMGRLHLTGPDVLDLLQWVCTNQLATMMEGQIRYTLICHERGGILDDVLVYRWSDSWSMVVNASNREKILAWLNQHRGNRQVTITDQTFETGMIAVQGPRAIDTCRGLTEHDASSLKYYFGVPTRCLGVPAILSRTGYTGEDGVEIIVGKDHVAEVWNALMTRGVTPCGLGARDTLRLEAAMPLYGHELSEDVDPIQAGLAWAVKFNKGDFVGRDAIQAASIAPKSQRAGLMLEGKRAARENCSVYQDTRCIGKVTSGSFSPTLQRSIAMAFLESDVASIGHSLQVDVRGERLSATVVKLPFYQRSNL